MALAIKLRISRALAVLTALTALVTSTEASAFCRATTCTKAHCATDSQACVTDGIPVFWASDCITISVQADGAPNAGVDFAAAKASVERAVEAWTSVTCPGGGHPSLNVKVDGPVECKTSEYNTDAHNANIVMFRDDVWPYASQSPDTLGYTNIHFDPDNGALDDADIEINATAEPLAVGREPKPNEADLDSIMTHEVGHLLGLGHSLNVEATMVAGYLDGTFALRTPAEDDVEGICAIYPPDRMAQSSSCEPKHGFSSLCAADQPPDQGTTDTSMAGAGGSDAAADDNTARGCSLAAPGRASDAPLGVLGVALCLVARMRRARRARDE